MKVVTRAYRPGARELALFTCIASALILIPKLVAAQPLPAPWTVSAVGGPTAGSATIATCGADCLGITVTGSGTAWETSDSFTFVHRGLAGAGAISARLIRTDPWATAGVMIRQSLSPQAPHAFIALSPPNGVSFQRRTAAGGKNWRSATGTEVAPVWVRVERLASDVTAYQSMDGVNWRVTGKAVIPFPEAVYVGLGVTSNNPFTQASATFTNIAIQGPPLPQGWASADIGNPDRRGDASYLAGRFSVTGGGTDIYDRADQFHYAYRPVSGNFDLVARVRSLENASPWTKSGVMIRASLTTDAANAFMLVSPSMGLAFQSRPDTGQLTLSSDGGAGHAPVWVKLERRGSLITGYRSPDGVAWTMIGRETVTLPGSFYAGLAVSSHANGMLVESVFEHVSIQVVTVNTPPVVSLTGPGNGSQFQSPASIIVSASASDEDGTISGVQFYAGGALIGSDATQPYSMTWTGALAGSHTLKAVAIDDRGATAASQEVRIDVRPPNQAPVVSLSAPGGGSVFATPAAIAVTAAATDPDGHVTRVDLYEGTRRIASAATAPYAVVWAAAPGAYTLTAIAYDDLGASTTSPPIVVTVQPPVRQWLVTFGLAADHATNVDSYVLELFTEGATTGTPLRSLTIAKPAAGQNASVDMTGLVTTLGSGRYVATISAVNMLGRSTRVASAAFVR